MAHSLRLLQLIRVRTAPTSLASILPSRIPLSRNYYPLRSLSKSFHSAAALHTSSPSPRSQSFLQRCFLAAKSYCSGHEFGMGRLVGVSAVLGSSFIRPYIAHCMDSKHITFAGYTRPSLNDHSRDLLADAETEANIQALLMLIQQLMVPIAVVFLVWTTWNYPVVLAVKLIVTFLSTKPSPDSVCLFIEQLQRLEVQHPLPFLHKFKSLYRKKVVDVEDYLFFCVARGVEIGDQKYTLLGFLGGWWMVGP